MMADPDRVLKRTPRMDKSMSGFLTDSQDDSLVAYLKPASSPGCCEHSIRRSGPPVGPYVDLDRSLHRTPLHTASTDCYCRHVLRWPTDERERLKDQYMSARSVDGPIMWEVLPVRPETRPSAAKPLVAKAAKKNKSKKHGGSGKIMKDVAPATPVTHSDRDRQPLPEPTRSNEAATPVTGSKKDHPPVSEATKSKEAATAATDSKKHNRPVSEATETEKVATPVTDSKKDHKSSPGATRSEERPETPISLPDLVPEKPPPGNTENLWPAEELKVPPPPPPYLNGKNSASRGESSTRTQKKSPKPSSKKREPPITAAEKIWLFEGFKSEANFLESIGFSIRDEAQRSQGRKIMRVMIEKEASKIQWADADWAHGNEDDSIIGGAVFSSRREARDNPFRANEDDGGKTWSEPPELSEEEIQKLRDALPYFEEDDDRVRDVYRCLAAAIPPWAMGRPWTEDDFSD